MSKLRNTVRFFCSLNVSIFVCELLCVLFAPLNDKFICKSVDSMSLYSCYDNFRSSSSLALARRLDNFYFSTSRYRTLWILTLYWPILIESELSEREGESGEERSAFDEIDVDYFINYGSIITIKCCFLVVFKDIKSS